MDTRDTANEEVSSVDIFLDFRVLHTLPSVCNSLRPSPRQVNVDRFGYCYRYKGIASPASSHPTVDQIYLGITCLYMFSLLGYSYTESYAYTTLLYKLPALGLAELTKMAGLGEQYGALQDRFEPQIAFCRAQYGFVREVLSGRYPLFLHNLAIIDRPPSSRERRLFSFLNSFDSLSSAMSLPLAQYLLHLYMVWAIRSANQVHLQGDFEDTWRFGQVVALVQILSCLKGCVKNCISTALLKSSICTNTGRISQTMMK
jgi:hypothetical protein